MSLLTALTTARVYKKTETLLKVAINMSILNPHAYIKAVVNN
jgi:arginine exporter protein ArgO